MILYLDTSALVKVYFPEFGREIVMAYLKQSEGGATNVLTYVEARAALARLTREGKLNAKQHGTIKGEIERDWIYYLPVTNNDERLRRAAEISEIYSLKAYDAVHLASAEYLRSPGVAEVVFACFDDRLNEAACKMGFPLLS